MDPVAVWSEPRHLYCSRSILLELGVPPRVLRRSGLYVHVSDDDGAGLEGEEEEAADRFTCDEFRMYEFKVRRCVRGRSHDWTDCPFAHPGEKARRRDPRRHHYSGVPCPEYRRHDGACPLGDACGMAHGVFEVWLHPARYRTIPCKDGRRCHRKVCFFAHTPAQLRILPSPVGLLEEEPLPTPPAPPKRRGEEKKVAEEVYAELLRTLEAMEVSPVLATAPPSSGGEHPTPDLGWVDDLLM